MPADFTGVVLAGGRSSRMGRDKATLPWGGATLLERMVDQLRQAGAGRVIVSGRPEFAGGVADDAPGRGPVAGLASCLRHCGDGLLVVVPVDLPLLGVGRIHALLDAVERGAAAGHLDGHPLPCALRVDAIARAAVGRVVREAPQGPSMRRMLAALGAVAIAPGADDADLRPCNTPEDWARLRA